MEKGWPVKRWFFLFVCAVILAAVFGVCASQAVSERQYQSAAGFVGALSEGAGIPEALKQTNFQIANIEAGKTLFQKYGYRLKDSFWENAVSFSIYAGWILAGFSGIVLIMEHRNRKQLIQRIETLRKYLEDVNLGKEPLLTRREDIFSCLEDEIYKTVTELRLARNRALKEHQVLADNLADISHQLKTPLTSMSLMAQLLAEQQQEGQAPYLERLNRQITRLERLTASLLTLSRLDAGTLMIEPQKMDVYSLLAQAAEPVEEMAQKKGVQLIIQSQPEEEVWADKNWTAEAMLNIIKNCIEHTPSGGEVHIEYMNNPLYMQITVQDTGPGFDPQDIPHLFQRYYRGKSAQKDSIGIGLALTRSILERQGGIIRAENPAEGGARFTVKIYYPVSNWMEEVDDQ